MQAFCVVCKFISLSPSLGVFLHFYSFQPGKQSGWLSLINRLKTCLLSPFTSSYKNFKGDFFKNLIEKTGKKYFYDGNVLKFPIKVVRNHEKPPWYISFYTFAKKPILLGGIYKN